MPEFRRIVVLRDGVQTEEDLRRVLESWPYNWRLVPWKGKGPAASAQVVIDDLPESDHAQALDRLNILLGDADFAASEYAKEE